MGLFPAVSTLLAGIIKAGDDSGSYSRTTGKLTIGLVNEITSTTYKTTVSAGGATTTVSENGILTTGYLTVTGTKNCLQPTQHYGDRLINAYETAEYYFGDIGSGFNR